MNITDFLLTRIAEDEAEANAMLRRYIEGGDVSSRRWRRVLAEREAKHRIMELHYVGDPDQWSSESWACRLCQWDEDCDSPKHEHQHGAGWFPCDTLRALAAVYADHPDYDESWRP